MSNAIRQQLQNTLIEHFSLDEGVGNTTTGDEAGIVLGDEGSGSLSWEDGIVGHYSTTSSLYQDTRDSDQTFANFHDKAFWGSVWLRPSANKSGHIMGRWGTSNATQWQWALWGTGDSSSGLNSNGQLLLMVSDDTNTDIEAAVTGNDVITAGGEHHVVFMFQPSDGAAKIWVDGVLEASNTLGATTLYNIGTSTGQLFSIHNRAQWSSGTRWNWDGDIDHIALGAVDDTGSGLGFEFDQDHVDWLYNEGGGREYGDFLASPPTPEETFQASFEDASGRDPLPTALIERTPARRLANHNVIVYKYPPYLVTKRVPIELEDYSKTLPGNMLWHKDPNSALFSMGRWAQIQGRRFTDNPVEVELTLRISDHPESFEEPT